ncbi:MAG: hypothetical protein KA369_18050 [Spirochaetes bacterium]|nr:hypothetical protein [Spirochaetota bacterium]
MVSLDKINLEYKSTALFGFTALLLSFVIGLLAGVRWNVVFLRALILMVVFGVIGFGICFILRKYVPEVYELVSSLAMLRSAPQDAAASGAEEHGEAPPDGTGEAEAHDIAEAGTEAGTPEASEFREFDKEGLAHFSTGPGGSGSINTKSGKLGKHILESEKMAKYEPKIMAQAVRTMMSKDKE